MHKSVLKKEVIKYLNPQPNENLIDATVGAGGHALEILKRNKPKGEVLGIEWDQEVYKKLKAKNINRLILENNSYVNLEKIVKERNFKNIRGILFDLGFLSWHIDESKKGFSFLKNEELDMRYNTNSNLTAKEILNKWPEKDIAQTLKEFGEERFARRISKNIIRRRKEMEIKTTNQLVDIIKESVTGWYRHKRIHPATRTFQALRIQVNNEIENLKKVLPQALKVIEEEGRIAVISFHSLEDRVVKRFFKKQSNLKKIKILTKKPIQPSQEEVENNPRSRSAKLRAAIKI